MRAKYAALRRARQRGREGARLRRPRRDVALRLRHARRGLREGDRAALEPGEAALRRPALLRARQAAKKYGKDKVPDGSRSPRTCSATCGRSSGAASTRPGRAVPGAADLDVDRRAAGRRSTTRCSMMKSAETFYTSLGFPTLPQTFWERSMLTRPRDREVVCHASAWDMDGKRRRAHQDVHRADRGRPDHDLPRARPRLLLPCVQRPAVRSSRTARNDGFHEAIGDTVNLSVTPAYLHQIGLVGAVKPVAGSHHQPADEDGARQGRLPAVRQADRRVALGRVRRPR